jgi:hypothetical protein
VQASHAQAVRERDHHAEAAKREAANAAASKAEVAALRDALAKKSSADSEASHAHAQELESVKVRICEMMVVATTMYNLFLFFYPFSQSALAKILQERDAAQERGKHDATEAAASKEAAAKAAREVAELRAALARQEHRWGGRMCLVHVFPIALEMFTTALGFVACLCLRSKTPACCGCWHTSNTVVPMDTSGTAKSKDGAGKSHDGAGKPKDGATAPKDAAAAPKDGTAASSKDAASKRVEGGCCGTKSPISLACWVLLFILTFLVGGALGLVIGVPAAYYSK